MKTTSLKNLCATTSLLVGLGGMSSAQADLYSGTLVTAGATDVYGITCPIPTSAVVANIDDGGAADGIFVGTQVIDPQGGASDNPIAPDGGGVSGNGVSAGPAAGNYLVVVNKNTAGFQNYTLDVDCFFNGNPYAGFQSALVQNQ
jgi:hypothetical protein